MGKFIEMVKHLNPTASLVLISAVVIIGIVLFAKFLSNLLKLAIISVMLICILYFLRQMGII
ncbi:MAG: hypothetical protein PF495_07375 [Spirochaetales bacterium]|nr:hypothetical protein [Spirochaetales bacterium]